MTPSLSTLMKKHGWTVKWLSEHVGRCERAIYYYLAGKPIPKTVELAILSFAAEAGREGE